MRAALTDDQTMTVLGIEYSLHLAGLATGLAAGLLVVLVQLGRRWPPPIRRRRLLQRAVNGRSRRTPFGYEW